MSGINPFRYSGPVEPDDLVDRLAERQAILDLAWSGNNARLAAPRRYGKTSLIRAVLADAEAQGWVGVYVDFFGVLTLADVAERIEAAYSEQLTGRLRQWFTTIRRTLNPIVRIGGGPVSVQVSGSDSSDPLVERLDLPRRLHDRDGRQVLVAFDEFQDVLAAGRADAVIRSRIQHHANVAAYLFAGSHVGMMEQLFDDKRRAFYAQAKPVALPPLDPVDLGDFLVDRFERSGREVGDVMGYLLDFAGGHPQRSMLLAHVLWQATPAGTVADEEAWVRTVAEVRTDYLDEARTIWARLSTTERQVLTSIATNGTGLYARASGNPAGASTTRAVETLIASSEIVADSRTATGYRVVDPLLADWLRSGRPDSSL